MAEELSLFEALKFVVILFLLLSGMILFVVGYTESDLYLLGYGVFLLWASSYFKINELQNRIKDLEDKC